MFNVLNFRYPSNNSNSGGPSSESSNNLPPRFKKMILHQGPFDSNDNSSNEVSLKPTNSSMLFKPKTPSLLPKSAKPTNNQNILDPVPSLLPSGPALPPASGKVNKMNYFRNLYANRSQLRFFELMSFLRGCPYIT